MPTKIEEQNKIGEPRTSPHDPVLPALLGFIHIYWLRLTSISALLLVPCFWHREIEAADLGSHLYNAWLVQLIHSREVHGLWIERRWNNVLFDYLLSGFGALFGLHAAERIAVSLCVLIFFWGMFALVGSASRRAPWYLVPGMAAFAYGWTFEMGFFNYYLALGLAFFAVAVFWGGRGWERALALVIAPFVVLAHPLGLFWLIAACAYLWFASRISPRYHFLVFLAAAAALLCVHQYLWSHYVVQKQEDPAYWFNGADQLVVFGHRYRIVERAFLVLVLLAVGADALQRLRRGRFGAEYFISLQLYALICLAVVLLPDGVHVSGHVGAIALLTSRLTSVSAALLFCILGALRPSRWHLAALVAIACTFFVFVYQDTASINRMEENVVQLVHTLPPSQRVMGTILQRDDSRVPIQHILDRACIGYCFSYGNYEPGTAMFRVRAMPGNPYVLSNYDLAVEMEDGDYEVQPEDLPVYQVYQCSESGERLCIHPLEAGEDNDDLGLHPAE